MNKSSVDARQDDREENHFVMACDARNDALHRRLAVE
jgi:hypothetical protein